MNAKDATFLAMPRIVLAQQVVPSPVQLSDVPIDTQVSEKTVYNEPSRYSNSFPYKHKSIFCTSLVFSEFSRHVIYINGGKTTIICFIRNFCLPFHKATPSMAKPIGI